MSEFGKPNDSEQPEIPKTPEASKSTETPSAPERRKKAYEMSPAEIAEHNRRVMERNRNENNKSSEAIEKIFAR